MALSFSCSDPLTMYHCMVCDLAANEKTQHFLHNCGNKIKSEVMCIKRLCDKCTVRSYSIMWMCFHQIKHVSFENYEYDETEKISKISLKTDRKIKCDQCAYSTTHKIFLKYHLNAKHTSADKIIWHQCEKCNWRSKYPGNLKLHLESKHSTGQKRYQCHECNYQASQRFLLNSHITQRHIPDHLINWHNCTICSYRSKQKNKLSYHMRATHTPDDQFPWFKCNICDFKAKKRFSLKHHTEMKHSKEPSQNYKCSECVYQTPLKYNLKKHTISKHTPDHLINWHHCKICAYKSKKSSGLNTHMKSMHAFDDQVNKSICKICNAKFKDGDSLRRHQVACHLTEMSCVDCGYKANSFTILRQHLKDIHFRFGKRFQCTDCLFETKKIFSFKRHVSKKHNSK